MIRHHCSKGPHPWLVIKGRHAGDQKKEAQNFAEEEHLHVKVLDESNKCLTFNLPLIHLRFIVNQNIKYATCHDTITIRPPNDKYIRIHKVYFVSGLAKKLLSISVATFDGVIIEFHPLLPMCH